MDRGELLESMGVAQDIVDATVGLSFNELAETMSVRFNPNPNDDPHVAAGMLIRMYETPPPEGNDFHIIGAVILADLAKKFGLEIVPREQ